MWEFLSEAVTGDAVAKGRSFLAGPLGRRVGSDHVALVDDGRRPGAVASSLWDDEGVPTGRTAVVDRGVLRSWLHDSASAARAGAVSTGNAVRDGWSSAPSPGPSNFFLAPGRGAARALLSATPRAFIVRDLIGLHTADAVSGDFSVGASGVLWEGGRVRRAVKGVTLAGNLLGLLKKIDAVASDLSWQGAFGSPTFRVSGLSIGGSGKTL